MNDSPDRRAQHGDVDADGEIVDALERRLHDAIDPDSLIDPRAHVAFVIYQLERAGAVEVPR